MAELGRPTEYNQATCDGAQAYLERTIGDDSNELPTVEGLAIALGMRRSTVYDWINPESERFHSEFSDIVENLLAHQSKKLVNNGLLNKFNASITKLMLTKHGYVEKTETDLSSKGEKLTFQTVVYANNDTAPVQPQAVPVAPTESAG